MSNDNDYAEYLSEDIRLVILRVLVKMPSYTANSSVLAHMLNKWGHNPSRDKVKTELHWLSDNSYITIDNVSDVLICKLTERGDDVANARISVPGVKKPGA